MIKVKRVYDQPDQSDGLRILVDRLWPRGLTKEKAGIDLWLKEIAPSHALRKWSHHDPKRWPEFKKRYFAELAENPGLVENILSQLKGQTVTLLFAAKDKQHNNALALKEFLEKKSR